MLYPVILVTFFPSDSFTDYLDEGIHGRPFISWDGVDKADGGFGGYCAHGSNVFPTWHRAYTALFEVRTTAFMHFMVISSN